MSKILVTIAILLFSSGLTYGQDEIELKELHGDIVIVRSLEVLQGVLAKPGIIISDGTSKNERIDIDAINIKNYNSELSTIVKVLTLVKEQGYELVHTNSGGGHQLGVFITNYILMPLS